jgi:hypothetical protein
VTTTITIGTRRTTTPGGVHTYTGLLRDGRTVIAECGHQHTNRTTSGRSTSAADCMRLILKAVANDATRASLVDNARTAWLSLTRGGFTAPTSTIEAAKVECAAAAEQTATRIDQLGDTLASLGLRVEVNRFGNAQIVPARVAARKDTRWLPASSTTSPTSTRTPATTLSPACATPWNCSPASPTTSSQSWPPRTRTPTAGRPGSPGGGVARPARRGDPATSVRYAADALIRLAEQENPR